MEHHRETIEALSRQDLHFSPPERVRRAALIHNFDAWRKDWERDPEAFWRRNADELVWHRPYDRISEINLPDHHWFPGGAINISYNCFERNCLGGKAAHTALHFESENGDARSYTYTEALEYVSRIGNALKAAGIGKGDRVVLYMPTTPEGVFTMHAVSRIGAIHSVVYAGMGPTALRQRLEDCDAKALVCADVTYRRGKAVDLLGIVDEAMPGLASLETIFVHRREESTPLASGRRDLLVESDKQTSFCAAEATDSEDPCFILYTSGTTGKPKGIVHVHGGYTVGVHMIAKRFFDMGPNDVWWSTSDIGWIVGHSCIAYGPMLAGVTQVIREGTPDYPDNSVIWRMVERYGVTSMFTAPTAVRMFLRFGAEALKGYKLDSLRLLFSAGEPLNPEAWRWAEEHIVGDHGHVLDNYWQTEVASPMVGTGPSMDGRPGFVGKPLPGVKLRAVTAEGDPVATGEGGLLVMEEPVPWMMRDIWGDRARYESVWNEGLGGYLTGDIGVCDEEGYWAVLGRSDDVLNVAGHRIGTADVEGALVAHPDVVEAAVIGLPDELRGEVIKAFVVPRAGAETEGMEARLQAHVRGTLGPIAQPASVAVVDSVPKTRSGKIMRRLLRARELGQDEGDTSTLED